MVAVSASQRRAILSAVAEWTPVAPSVELSASDRQELREQLALALGPTLGVPPESAMTQLIALRMTGG